ncbi:2-octaprenyl-6-methoxyphenyl hydroxylase [Marinomonas agarivorans]|nr:2-octaprenyl-6-methoxyphenyl hydroxylase [Marinomonas agarivorans]
MMESKDTDILIIGGGLVGASLALALSAGSKNLDKGAKPLNITLVESIEVTSSAQPSFDERSTVLSRSSANLLAEIGVWQSLQQQSSQQQAAPIKHIHTSEQGCFGFTRLHAEDYQLDGMGYVVENRVLGRTIYQQLKEQTHIECLIPAKVTKVVPQASHYECQVEFFHSSNSDSFSFDSSSSNSLNTEDDSETQNSTVTYRAKLVVLCDGGRSSLAQELGLSEKVDHYEQAALIANIELDRPHQGWAYERFTAQGPIAMLPLNDYIAESNRRFRAALVWTTPMAELERRLTADNPTFLHELQQAFGYRLGYFKQVGARASYPLKVQKVNELIRSRLAVLGNAAHTLHPVAGQGFNLALRGALLLAKTVLTAHEKGKDIGAYSVLKEYEAAQIVDRDRIQTASHALIRVFGAQTPLLSTGRNLAMVMLDACPTLKAGFAHHAMGLNVPKKRFQQQPNTHIDLQAR